MNSEMARNIAGNAPVTRQDRQTAQQGRQIIDQVRLTSLRVDGAMALAGHIMQEAEELDMLRRRLAGENLSLNLLLAEFEETALQQTRSIQRGLFNAWGL